MDDKRNCDVLDITGNIYQKYVKKKLNEQVQV